MEELSEKLSIREFREWQAFSQLEPFGIESEELGPALICSLIHNVNRSKSSPPAEPKKYMPLTQNLREKLQAHGTIQQSTDEQWALLKSLVNKG